MAWQPSEKPAVTLENSSVEDMSKNERIKLGSQGLFFVDPEGGVTFGDEVDALTNGSAETISNNAKELSKFFGIYKQQGRGERGKKTKDFFFMLRIKCPAGGQLTKGQWLALDSAADLFADGTIRITSRQAIQYHHVYGPKLAPLVRHLNRDYREGGTLAACGDVNRNVMGSPIDGLAPACDPRGTELSEEIAEDLVPRTSAYFQVFLSDGEGRSKTPINPEEPVYGEQYLPRKFKVGIAHAGDNAVDLRSQDVGLLPVDDAGEVWDFWSGGGMGMTHNKPETAPLLGEYLGRVRRDQVVDAIRAVVTLQKENGERKDRRQARWKYTIRRMGLETVRKALRDRFGIDLEDAEALPIPPMELHHGFHEMRGGGGWYGISVESGRLKGAQREAVREAVETLDCRVRFTPQQDLMLIGVRDAEAVEAILRKHGVALPADISIARRNAMACPAKPTCGLAMTDAENVLPSYFDAIEAAGHGDVDVVIRMTGCPNMCARPPTAEIGIYGYGKNDHVVLVGGSREGTRIGKPLYRRLSGEEMVPALVGLFGAIKEHNTEGLPAGEFLDRTPVEQLRSWIGIEAA
ncbi:MAG: NADPH-dependent assimilatory sulfite reductase hemoprotein subunit [Deltaproteobacteria bacterium]|nr:NADPH-dependent assimilatory sulfite reductase hemoprotein subunit [Deltaproteobacteria bacterium]MBW2447900.1 NADPH-dependent assimilatory sulfite reductase hemoprotein subunit [Deltaproteobacteria bacterium]